MSTPTSTSSGSAPRPRPSGRAAATIAASWQAALAAEHQAVFAYSLLGPRLSGSSSALAVQCSNAHEALRNATMTALAVAGLAPAPPSADYPSLYPVDDATAARRLALRVEGDCAQAWRFLYAHVARTGTPADLTTVRASAQAALTASAVRATRWRMLLDPAHATTAFPGVE